MNTQSFSLKNPIPIAPGYRLNMTRNSTRKNISKICSPNFTRSGSGSRASSAGSHSSSSSNSLAGNTLSRMAKTSTMLPKAVISPPNKPKADSAIVLRNSGPLKLDFARLSPSPARARANKTISTMRVTNSKVG